jgi:DNA-binding NtrC family response regulator
MRKRILLVDDDASIRAALKIVLEPAYETIEASSIQEGLKAVRREAPDLILLDIMMPGGSGLAFLDEVRLEQPRMPVIMLTGLNAVRTAVEAMKHGAVDYLTKPFDTEELCLRVSKTFAARELESEVQYLRAQAVDRYGLHGLVGKSAAMQEVYAKIEQVADTRATVLITGESGTGKELVARALHYNSSRRDRPLVALNCAAIPDTLIESELFGHERGAFTGAESRRIGHFELAHGGTLFLDEITELNTGMQAKLLRVLQHREFMRIGGSQPIQVDVRIIAATNKNLGVLLRRGELREDMYYRINVVSIHLPPLRERQRDIPLLAQHFMSKHDVAGLRSPREFSKEATEVLMRYHWPGNVRELENAVEQVSIWCRDPIIEPKHLPSAVRMNQRPDAFPAEIPDTGLSLEEAVVELERKRIVDARRRTDFVQTHAAALLGISRRMLKYRMDILRIDARSDDLAEPRGPDLWQ